MKMPACVSETAIAAPTPELAGIRTQPRPAAAAQPAIHTATSDAGKPDSVTPYAFSEYRQPSRDTGRLKPRLAVAALRRTTISATETAVQPSVLAATNPRGPAPSAAATTRHSSTP